MAASINPTLSTYSALSAEDRTRVRWGIWVLEGMPETPAFSDTLISTHPTHPSIATAMQLFLANRENVIPDEVTTGLKNVVTAMSLLSMFEAPIPNRHGRAIDLIMNISPLTKTILGTFLTQRGQPALATMLNDQEQVHQVVAQRDPTQTQSLNQAALTIYQKITGKSHF